MMAKAVVIMVLGAGSQHGTGPLFPGGRFAERWHGGMSSLDSASTMKYNLAARWLLRQSGTVQQRGEEFSPEDLAFQPAQEFVDPETGETFEVSPAGPFFGLNKLLKALESMNGQSTLDKRGELRTAFYIHMMRKAGRARLRLQQPLQDCHRGPEGRRSGAPRPRGWMVL